MLTTDASLAALSAADERMAQLVADSDEDTENQPMNDADLARLSRLLAEDDEPAPVGKRTRRGVHAVSKGLPKSAPKVMTGVSELATPDVPPGACA